MTALVDGANWAEIVLAFATVGVALSIIIAAVQVREAKRTRHMEMAASISARWDSELFAEVRKDILAATQATGQNLKDVYFAAKAVNDPLFYKCQYEMNFFEDLGALVKHKGVSFDWVHDTMCGLTMDRWDMWQPTVQQLRQDQQKPTIFENFEYLRNDLVRTRKGQRRIRRWLLRKLDR